MMGLASTLNVKPSEFRSSPDQTPWQGRGNLVLAIEDPPTRFHFHLNQTVCSFEKSGIQKFSNILEKIKFKLLL